MLMLFIYLYLFSLYGLITVTHSRDGRCDLFPQEVIREWVERINPRQVMGQIQAEHAQHGLSCPNCRQFNAKVKNQRL